MRQRLIAPHRTAPPRAGLRLGSIDLTTGAVTWNKQMWRLIGRMPESVVMDERPWPEEGVHPDDREGLALAPERWHDKGRQDQ